MNRNPILDVPLTTIMRPEIALPLQHVLGLHTVGNFLSAWRNPRNHDRIERLFDTPRQARHAAAVCATWLGIRVPNSVTSAVCSWWPTDETPVALKA